MPISVSTIKPDAAGLPESPTPETGIIPLQTSTTAPDVFILLVEVPANCRQGPGTVYEVINSALPGEQVQVLGKNVEGTWWYSKVDNDKCWISNIAGALVGDLDLLPIIQAPPTPLPTATEKPTEIDFDQDGYGVSVDCNDKDDKIHPGAPETPDDKVDSNCNGDDDT